MINNQHVVCLQMVSDWGLRDYKCNYFMAEESDNAWESRNGGLSLVTSGTIGGLDPTADEHCSTTDFVVDVDTDCQSMISAASSEEEVEMETLFQGGGMKGDGVFAVIVVIVLVGAITTTYCLTKNNKAEGEDAPAADTDVPESPTSTDGMMPTQM